jgi:hypothetical protein
VRKDFHHDSVIRALKHDGWRIVDEQTPFVSGKRTVYIDIEAEQSQERLLIFVEVKGFQGNSQVSELADALGQYLLYRHVIDDAYGEDVPLFLAIPEEAYVGIFQEPLGLELSQKYGIKLLVIDTEQERILQWQR